MFCLFNHSTTQLLPGATFIRPSFISFLIL
uniref:Uncharacterized protein n=1 Tax=Rhizophora mucronata TaxID=61149 RepID=A0A2P2Q4H1_RHIMU